MFINFSTGFRIFFNGFYQFSIFFIGLSMIFFNFFMVFFNFSIVFFTCSMFFSIVPWFSSIFLWFSSVPWFSSILQWFSSIFLCFRIDRGEVVPGTHRLLSRCTFTNFNASSLSIYPSIASIFPVFCHGVTRCLHHYPYVTSVCLTRTQMHRPQSLQLHRINGFARFFHGFLSVLLLHSGHTSKLQFFHCLSNVSRVLYAIMVPHRSLDFTWHHFTLSPLFPPIFTAF